MYIAHLYTKNTSTHHISDKVIPKGLASFFDPAKVSFGRAVAALVPKPEGYRLTA